MGKRSARLYFRGHYQFQIRVTGLFIGERRFIQGLLGRVLAGGEVR